MTPGNLRTRLAFLLLLFIMIQCRSGSDKVDVMVEPAFHSSIAGFTSGTISSGSVITILLSQDYEGAIEPMTPVTDKLFSFSPSLKGKTYWVDKRTIEFRPEKPMPSGEYIKVDFNVGSLFDLPREQRTFSFGFQVINQSFSLTVNGFESYNLEEPVHNRIGGVLHSADRIDNGAVPGILKATQGGRSLPVSWMVDPSGRKHEFTIDSVLRQEARGQVVIDLDGKSMGVSQELSQTIEIPALGDFSVVEVKVVQQPEQYVSVRFSDPVKKNQNLTGLIHIKDVVKVRYLIDGNEVRVYPATRISGTGLVHVEEGIISSRDYRFSDPTVYTLAFEDIKPALRLSGRGVIIPDSDGLIFPFEAVNLRAVDVRIIRIYENNVAQFLQDNTLQGDNDYSIKRAGRLIHRQTIDLESPANGHWNTFSLDLSKLIRTEPGAIYRVELGFQRRYSTYPCPDQEVATGNLVSMEMSSASDLEKEMAYWDAPDNYYSGYDHYDSWNWQEQDNPCHDSYYGKRRWASRNVLASDLGIIAKGGSNNSMTFAVSDLSTTKPIPNVVLDIYNFQQQLMTTVFTDLDGMAKVELESKPFLLIARHEQHRGYLRLDDGSSLSLSRFDVSGQRIQQGLKGFIYGERGVWRPGDSLFVMFVMEDKLRQLPQNHPVIFELVNSMGQVVQRMSRTHGNNGFYNFSTATSPDAPTGNWTGRVNVGGSSFSRILKIEAIKPNRLKINFDFGAEKLLAGIAHQATLKANWLHGATARNLRATVDVTLQQTNTEFNGYPGFVFDDPSRSFTSEEVTVFDGRINEQGEVLIRPDLGVHRNAPGMLKAGFVVRVFEEGGDFSIDRFSLPYSPFKHYVGIRPPEGDPHSGMLVTGKDHKVDVVTVDSEGRGVSRSDLEVQVYKVEWRWWWDASQDNLASYVGNTRNQPVQYHRISTVNGTGSFNLRIEQPDWGRFLIRVTDPQSGHSAARTVYIDWPDWASRSITQDPSAAQMLTFALDKENYKVGEMVELTIPAGKEGRALLSLETGSKVIRAWWVEAKGAETKVTFPATPEMAPNAYIHISLVQPHSRVSNDLPIRLYGVMPLFVEDPATRLAPQLEMAASLAPQETAVIKIREADGKKMTYTLALVDEGLLDLTRFATPDPWKSFYAREALGVRTWDLYDFVLGAYGGRIERVFSIGGDEDAGARPESQANRFPPMVRFLGPFTLEKGRSNNHSVKIPQYVGSVRVMVVAGDQGAYGFTQKTVPVKKPLMVLATLPRVLTPTERVKMPVTVFAMDAAMKDVKVEIITNNLLKIQGAPSRQVKFTQTGDQVITFELDVASAIGVGTIKVIASSGREKAEYDIEIAVRNPNLPVTWFEEALLEQGQEWALDYQPVGISGTNTGMLEISSIPPVDFGRRLKYLLDYPHGCAEQVTSAAFPQLFMESVMEVEPPTKSRIQDNIKSALRILASYQRPAGGIGYWPGAREVNEWASTYAAHFMLEAEAKGYALPVGMKDNLLAYQRGQARNWSPLTAASPQGHNVHDQLTQAYRLYTLALAGTPEMGAMNRMREMTTLSVQGRWRLAAAYALAGQPEAAQGIIRGIAVAVEQYSAFNASYGSRERDLAMILETLTLMDNRVEGIAVLKQISDALSADTWMSTQTTAYCLLAVAKFAGASGTASQMKYEYKLGGGRAINGVSQLPIVQVPVEITGTSPGSVKVINTGSGIMFARMVLTGTPEIGAVTAQESNLGVAVSYTGMDGKPIDVKRMAQGTDFLAVVSITNPGQMGNYSDMVITQVFPSGWEIHNIRMDEVATVRQASVPTYEDIRDDRVHTHFDLASGQTKKFVVVLNAAYLGRFFLPGVFSEAMYNNRISARKAGQWVEVVKPGE